MTDESKCHMGLETTVGRSVVDVRKAVFDGGLSSIALKFDDGSVLIVKAVPGYDRWELELADQGCLSGAELKALHFDG
jgi:hypothetical protein